MAQIWFRCHRDGWMGMAHSRSYSSQRSFSRWRRPPLLLVCADDVEARAKDAREQFAFSATPLIAGRHADPAVQAVSITTPNYMHREIVEAAARAGKHIFCEKTVGEIRKKLLKSSV